MNERDCVKLNDQDIFNFTTLLSFQCVSINTQYTRKKNHKISFFFFVVSNEKDNEILWTISISDTAFRWTIENHLCYTVFSFLFFSLEHFFFSEWIWMLFLFCGKMIRKLLTICSRTVLWNICSRISVTSSSSSRPISIMILFVLKVFIPTYIVGCSSSNGYVRFSVQRRIFFCQSIAIYGIGFTLHFLCCALN